MSTKNTPVVDPKAAAPADRKTRQAKAIRVVSRSAGPAFRRGGHAFTAEPTTLLIEDLQDEQLDAIRAEPLLIVTDTVVDVPA